MPPSGARPSHALMHAFISTLGRGLHVRGHAARCCVRRVRGQRVLASHRRLARAYRDADRSGVRRAGASLARVIGLFKTKVIHGDGPWRGFEDVELATLEWVAWFNQERLLAPLGYVPPAEFEAQYYEHTTPTRPWVYSTQPVS